MPRSSPPVEVIGALELPDDPEVVLPPDLGLSDAEGADPERRRTPEDDRIRVGYRRALLDCPEEVAHTGPLEGVRLHDIEVRVHLPDTFPEDLLLGLGDEVDPGHDRGIGEGEHRGHLQGGVRPRYRGEDDDPERLRRVGGAAEAEPGALDQEEVGALSPGPGDGVAHHHHPGVVRAEIAGVDLPRRDAELGRKFFILERPDDVDLDVDDPVLPRKGADDLPDDGGLPGRRRPGDDGELHAPTGSVIRLPARISSRIRQRMPSRRMASRRAAFS